MSDEYTSLRHATNKVNMRMLLQTLLAVIYKRTHIAIHIIGSLFYIYAQDKSKNEDSNIFEMVNRLFFVPFKYFQIEVKKYGN